MGCSSAGRTPDSGSGSRGFDPYHPSQFIMCDILKKHAENLEDILLEKLASGDISDFSIQTNPDDLKIDITSVLTPPRPLKFIKVDVNLRNGFEN